MSRAVWFVGTAFVIALSLLSLSPYLALGELSSAQNASDGVVVEVKYGLIIEVDKQAYLKGEVVKMRIYVLNLEERAIEVAIISAGYSVYDSNGRNLISLFVSYTYGPQLPKVPAKSKTLFETLEWNQQALDLRKVGAGTYTIRIFAVSISRSAHPDGECVFETAIRIYPNIDAFPRASKWGFTFY